MRSSQISLGSFAPAEEEEEEEMGHPEGLQEEGSFQEPQQTIVLKVSVHCRGCMAKVKKLLQKIDGVRVVHIDGEEGRVTVSGTAHPEVLVQALSGKGKRVVQVLSSHQEGPQRLGLHLQQARLERKGTRKARDRRKEEEQQETPRRSAFDVARFRDMVVHAVAGRGSSYVRLISKVDGDGGGEDGNAGGGSKEEVGRSIVSVAPRSPLRSPAPPGSPAVAAVRNLWRQMTATAS